MHRLLSTLPAFMLPFVTRSLRGGRAKRYLVFSLLLASLTGVLGLWLTLGSGQFEQSVRSEIGLEPHEWELERQTFTVYVHDDWERREAERDLERLAAAGARFDEDGIYGSASELYSQGQAQLYLAATSPVRTAEQARLRDQARALLDFNDDFQAGEPGLDTGASFPWADPDERAMLETIVAADALPTIATYRSPLSLGQGLAFTGFMAGLILAALGTVFAPLLVAVQQAQERHENTLMPLSGTALSPRELALGLAAGPGAIVAIFAAPQLVVFVLCATIAGELGIALALLAALATTTVTLTFGAQLLGQLVGHKRTPGIIGIALMGLAGSAWLVAAGLVADSDPDVAGLSAVIPHVGLAALLTEVFVDLHAGFEWVLVGTFAWTIGAAVLAGLMLTALSRRIEGQDGALLSVGQAGLGAVVCMALVSVAFPDLHGADQAVRQYLGLAALAAPLSLLFMARVPTGDGPAQMRSIDLPRLLAEFGGWAAAYFVISSVLFGTEAEALHPVALGWLTWCVGVVALLCVRTVAAPTKIAGNIWAGFCAFCVFLGFIHAAMWAFDGASGLDEVFLLAELSPVLGLAEVALVIVIPISLVHRLRKSLGSVTGAPATPAK